jgi:SAM-dependent methyltransferase
MLQSDNPQNTSSESVYPERQWALTLCRLIPELWRGKSLARSLENHWLRRISLSGRGVDLGARDASGSYYRFITLAPESELLFCDLNPRNPAVVPVDLERPLPWESGRFDFALLMHVLMLLSDPRATLTEARRILKPGGRLLLSVPYLHRLIPEPNDYYRFSAQALDHLLRLAGFASVSILTISVGPATSALSVMGVAIPRFLMPLLYAFTFCIDALLARIGGKRLAISRKNYPMTYIVEARA